MKVLLIGANGQLGSDLNTVLAKKGAEVRRVVNREIDVRNAEAVLDAVGSERPDAVVNTAAFHKLEDCDVQPSVAYEVNAVGARNLAAACKKYSAALMHFSTDYVFDGTKGTSYSESDLTSPINVYGVTKVAGEQMVAYTMQRYFVVRVCGLYGKTGPSGKGLNFVENMLKKAGDGAAIRVVDDQVLSPSYTLDLAERLTQLLTTEAYGLYHLSSEGQCSWYEFASKIFELAGVRANLSPCKTADFPSPVQRPLISAMDKGKFNQLGLGKMPHWTESLERYLDAR
jgi:dTDP-4-dehydrorhamnose reductase